MKKVLSVVLLIAVLVGFRMYNRAGSEKSLLADMQKIVARMDFPDEDTVYLNGVLERVHPAAFDEAYNMGTRRRGAKLDEEAYVSSVFDRTIRACNADGKEYLVEDLEGMRDAILEGLKS